MSESNEPSPLHPSGASSPNEEAFDEQFLALLINPSAEDGEAPGSTEEHGARRALLLDQILNTNWADLDDEGVEILRRLTPEEGLPLLDERARRERARRAVHRTSTKKPSRTDVPGPAGQHAYSMAIGLLERFAAVVPKRIDSEEIGDAVERIHRLVSEGRPWWCIYLIVARTCWAVLRHSVWHGVEQFVGVVMKLTAGLGDDQ